MVSTVILSLKNKSSRLLKNRNKNNRVGHNKNITVPERKLKLMLERSLCMWFMSLSSILSQLSSISFRKSFALIIMCLALLLTSWESQKNDAALLQTSIPEESIRLRILAHSDRPQDQAIKMLVRDRIVEQMNSWAVEATTLQDARAIVNDHVEQLNHVVGEVLQENGQAYAYQVSLAEVDFPTKSYGGLVYPGGMYEALLISLGDAEGRNWWCVLFPPLCFVDSVSGEATALNKASANEKAAEDVQVEQTDSKALQIDEQDRQAVKQSTVAASEAEVEVEVKFFLADVWNWIKGLFT